MIATARTINWLALGPQLGALAVIALLGVLLIRSWKPVVGLLALTAVTMGLINVAGSGSVIPKHSNLRADLCQSLARSGLVGKGCPLLPAGTASLQQRLCQSLARGGLAGKGCPPLPAGRTSPQRYAEGSATFVFDGVPSVSVQEGGGTVVSQTFPHSPRLSYSGPAGCQGRAFTALKGNLFRYSSRDAYLVWGGQAYHFIHGPRQHRGVLVFDQTFSGQHISVQIACPPPPASGPLLPRSY